MADLNDYNQPTPASSRVDVQDTNRAHHARAITLNPGAAANMPVNAKRASFASSIFSLENWSGSAWVEWFRATVFGRSLVAAADSDTAQTVLGGTTVGKALFTAASQLAGRGALGLPVVPNPFHGATSATRTTAGYFASFSASSGDQFNASTGIFTCATAGVYAFNASFQSFGSPSSNSAHLFNMQASRAAGSLSSQVSIDYDSLSNFSRHKNCSLICRLAVGDTVRNEVLTYGPSGSTVLCTLFTGAFISS